MVGQFCVVVAMLLLGVTALGGCRPSPTTSPGSDNTPGSDKLQIMVSIAPQKYFVDRIGDRNVIVNVMVPPGAEPHTFEPKPEQLKALSRANAYLRIRIEFEAAWMNKFTAVNPRMLIVDMTQGIQRIPISTEFGENSQTSHASENLDPHIWLSPKLVKVQAQTIYDALVKLDAKHQADYQANLKQFLADLDRLDADIKQTLEGIKTRKFIVFHPGWGYFARDYQLEQVPIEVGGQEPSAAELAELITKAKQANIKVVFAEPQFSQQLAETVAQEIDGKVLLIDPLAPDWMSNMKAVSSTFASVMSQHDRFYQSASIQPLFTVRNYLHPQL
jgi:zinc transport system substrate-binding protein